MGRKGRFGWPLYEIAVVICVAGVVIWQFSWRFDWIAARAERESMEMTLSHMREGLQSAGYQDLVRLRTVEHAGNPVFLLESLPGNYFGEFDVVQQNQIPSGNWYYLKTLREICYKPRERQYIEFEGDSLCFLIKPPAKEGVSGRLESVQKYHWLD